MSKWRKRMIRRLSEAQNHRCCYCGVSMVLEDHMHPRGATIEHVIPRSMGGTRGWWNLAAACLDCNQKRGNSDHRSFLQRFFDRCAA